MAEGAKAALGFDVGGTKIAAVRLDPEGRAERRLRVATPPAAAPDRLAERLAALARDLGGGPDVPVGVGIAGQVATDGELVYLAPNLGWREVRFGRHLVQAFGRDGVFLANDVRCATYAEWRRGAGRGAVDLVALFLGTGVGGGIVSGGRLLQGRFGSAGELGHLTVALDGPPCTCGNRGCLEAFAGGWALPRRLEERAAAHPRGAALLAAAADGGPLDARAVFAAARAGNPLAEEVVATALSALAAAVVSIANALNPERLVLGGGVVDGEPDLLVRLAERLPGRMLPPAAGALALVRSELGADAVAIGAALLAQERSGGGAGS